MRHYAALVLPDVMTECDDCCYVTIRLGMGDVMLLTMPCEEHTRRLANAVRAIDGKPPIGFQMATDVLRKLASGTPPDWLADMAEAALIRIENTTKETE